MSRFNSKYLVLDASLALGSNDQMFNLPVTLPVTGIEAAFRQYGKKSM